MPRSRGLSAFDTSLLASWFRLLLGGFITVRAGATLGRTKLGLVLQAMFVLVGWHYVKQSFGVLSVLSARRGVRFSLGERRVVLAHCISAWLFARFEPARRGPGSQFGRRRLHDARPSARARRAH
ncbi:MAG: hypothetical protein QM756_34310 [Polyangiaceae bacterium]